MALTKDQKKHLVIGGGLGAAALLVGNWLFGSRRAIAAPLLSAHDGNGHHERKPHHEDRGDSERGTYGHGKHDRHRGGRD